MRKLTQELVRRWLDYDAETGVLTWKARDQSEFPSERAWKTWTARYSGKPAGAVISRPGFSSVQILGTNAPKIIWLWLYGFAPKLVTHKNGDSLDNRLANLDPYDPPPKESREKVTREYAQELFEYDKETGKLYWRHRPRSRFRSARAYNTHSRYAGKETGCANKTGRLEVNVGSRTWFAHRLIWLMHTGESPEGLDHIDRDPKNNRIENLRPCSKSENMINSRRRAAGEIAGVYEVRPGIWHARLGVRGKQVYLGSFRSHEEARQAYEEGLRKNFGEFVPNG